MDEWDNLAVELKEGDSLISAPDLDHISFGSNSKPIFGNDVGSIAVTHQLAQMLSSSTKENRISPCQKRVALRLEQRRVYGVAKALLMCFSWGQTPSPIPPDYLKSMGMTWCMDVVEGTEVCEDREVWRTTSDRDLNLVLPVIASLVYCERYMLDHAATEVSIHLINETPASGAQLANALVVLSSATEDREIQLALGTEPNTNFRPLVLMEVLTRSGHGMFLPALRLNLDLCLDVLDAQGEGLLLRLLPPHVGRLHQQVQTIELVLVLILIWRCGRRSLLLVGVLAALFLMDLLRHHLVVQGRAPVAAFRAVVAATATHNDATPGLGGGRRWFLLAWGTAALVLRAILLLVVVVASQTTAPAPTHRSWGLATKLLTPAGDGEVLGVMTLAADHLRQDAPPSVDKPVAHLKTQSNTSDI
uniref:(California timema) hypothetical protein n=1 Tax=Timema californicum TaxID=61474 RepID=A0A7R9P5N4_TIMCA|nr:unnamed protein product [Timema californicum]